MAVTDIKKLSFIMCGQAWEKLFYSHSRACKETSCA